MTLTEIQTLVTNNGHQSSMLTDEALIFADVIICQSAGAKHLNVSYREATIICDHMEVWTGDSGTTYLSMHREGSSVAIIPIRKRSRA